MADKVELLIVGGGKMGEALLGGLLAAGRSAESICVAEPIVARRDELADRYGIAVSGDVAASAGAILATKPDVIPTVAGAVTAAGTDRILSIAAGVTLPTLDVAAGTGVPIVRAMPNTPALVSEGAAAICGNDRATEDDLGWAEEILGAVGRVVRVPEHLMDAVTGLSGSGPAYVFLVAEAMIEAGVLMGLGRPVAVELANQTLLGAATLLAEGRSPADLRADVTSPGGTTAAGLRELERHGVRAAFAAAVEAATRRSVELGSA
ncbi:MAG: pyrroline-5-carboxylate reductase [Acidimicrobiales bacterium]|nr:pyrroline-5-carboxylate reductase [Acidimicrobiales bacterium]MYB80108.1 pyrroline-5-carboxylate reductase [Acidimicrobiales bacterium]MYI12571.1 pyrroline-5-carboxylate reductase [Acidimicrobiales bacterium]